MKVIFLLSFLLFATAMNTFSQLIDLSLCVRNGELYTPYLDPVLRENIRLYLNTLMDEDIFYEIEFDDPYNSRYILLISGEALEMHADIVQYLYDNGMFAYGHSSGNYFLFYDRVNDQFIIETGAGW